VTTPSPTGVGPPLSLKQAIRDVATTRWQGQRNGRGTVLAMEAIAQWLEMRHGVTLVEAVTDAHVRAYIAHARNMGHGDATIARRLACLKLVLGRPIPSVPAPRLPKWWLPPPLHASVCEDLRRRGLGDPLADFIDWTCFTGLRLEETLRCERHLFTGLGTPRPSLQVPGTKTQASLAPIPLMADAAALAVRRLGPRGAPTDRLFTASYRELWEGWGLVRTEYGLGSVATATLKALRRTFAKYARDKGMPLDALRRYLRHADVETTLGYLDLIGDSTEDLRQWL
jgi:hypothetical protein